MVRDSNGNIPVKVIAAARILTEELEALELYIQIERFRFDNKFDYSIVIDPSIDPQTTEIPSLETTGTRVEIPLAYVESF